MTSTSSRHGFENTTKGAVAFGATSFAGIMLATVALFQVLEGIAAIANDDIYVNGVNYVYELDITAWGWIHLILGIIGIAIGIAILAGQTWGRLGGLVVAFLGALAGFAFLPYYPLWSLVIVAFNVFVVWALCTQIAHDETR